MFKIGTNVSYSSLGSGVIEGIDSVLIDDIESKFYIVKFEMNGITLKVPVNDDKIRLVISIDQIKDVISVLRGEGDLLINIPNRWNKRCNLYSEVMTSGDIFKIAKLANVLHIKKRKTFNEMRVAENCCKVIASEFSCVEKIGFLEALNIVYKNLNNTVKI